jgi:hypothetical protein
MATIQRRSPEAVGALEALQQQERSNAGDRVLSVDDFLQLLKDDVHLQIMGARMDSGGLAAVIEAAGRDDALAKQRCAELLEAWRLDDPSQWSRYEPPGTRWAIADLCARIEAVFARHQRPLSEVPVVGTLTTGQVTARTQRAPMGAPLVLIDNGFFKFSGILATLAVIATYDREVRGGFTEGTVQLVSDLAATQTIMNTCLYMYPRQMPPDMAPQVARYQDAFSLFVIGHEYAHISTGDLDAHPLGQGRDDRDRRAKELQADKIGLAASVEAAHDPAAGVYGAILYFAGLDLLARAAAAYESRPAPSPDTAPSDYPSPFERTMALLNWVETSPYGDLKGHMSAAADCYNLILTIWDLVLPGFWAVKDMIPPLDPASQKLGVLPEVATYYVVSRVWQRVRDRLRTTSSG